MRHGCLVLLGVCAFGCQESPNLSTTAENLVVISPVSHDFGTIVVGQSSPIFTENVNPSAGNQDDIIDSITASCPDFTINAPGLPFEVYRICEILALLPCVTTDLQTYQFTTSFHPSIPGPQSCVVTITLDGGSLIRTLTLSGTGMAPPIDIDVSPTSIQFGDVRINTPSTAANVTVRNLGGSTLSVTSVTVPGGYTLGGPASFTVGPGASQPLTVTCQPPATGQLGGNMIITSNDPNTPAVLVALGCNGITSNLAISPSPAVTTTRVGEPVNQMITLTNSGGAATTILSVDLAGAGLTLVSAPPANTPLAANGGSANVVVGFAATAQGDSSATLTVVTTDGTRNSQITATAKLASMSLTPDGAVDFGPVCAGKMTTQSFTLLGNGDGAFQLQTIADPAAPFSINKPTLPSTVQGSGANQIAFDVTAAPQAPGVATSTIVVGTDIPGSTPRTIDLSVTGLGAGVTATPTDVDLGSLALDVTSIGQTVSVTNCAADPETIENARIEGVDAAEFAIVQQPPSSTIAPSKSGEWLVVFTPHTKGQKQATFAVDYAEGTATVNLTGEGLNPDLTGGVAETSYYSCGVGTASAAWPVGVALAMLLRRKRRR